MNFDDFRQALRALFTLEMYALVEAGAIDRDDYQTWRTFKIDPLRWFLIADDDSSGRMARHPTASFRRCGRRWRMQRQWHHRAFHAAKCRLRLAIVFLE